MTDEYDAVYAAINAKWRNIIEAESYAAILLKIAEKKSLPPLDDREHESGAQ